MHTIQVSSLTPDQFGELVESRAYNGTLRALADYRPTKEPSLPDRPTRRQVAEFLQISLVSLNEWSKPNDDRPALLTPIKIGTRVRYDRDAVLALAESSPKYRRK